MGVFQFTTPDGRKFKVTAPDVQTAIESFNVVMEGQPPAKPPEGRQGSGLMDKIDAGMRGAADTMSFGLADEIAASMSAGPKGSSYAERHGRLPTQIEADYQTELTKQRAIDQYDQENAPAMRIGGQVAGGLLGAGGIARQGITTAGRAVGAGLPPRMGLGALEGAAYGGAYGLGSGEGGAENRLANAATGAVTGGAVGAVFPAITAGLRPVLQPIASAVQARLNPSGYAAQKIVERLGADNLTPYQAGNKIARAGQNGDNLSLRIRRAFSARFPTSPAQLGSASKRLRASRPCSKAIVSAPSSARLWTHRKAPIRPSRNR